MSALIDKTLNIMLLKVAILLTVLVTVQVPPLKHGLGDAQGSIHTAQLGGSLQ